MPAVENLKTRRKHQMIGIPGTDRFLIFGGITTDPNPGGKPQFSSEVITLDTGDVL